MNPLQRYYLRWFAHKIGLVPPRALVKRTSTEEFCRHLRARRFRPATVIDVGVAHGTFEIYHNFPDATFLLVEPMEEFNPALDWIAAHYKCFVEHAAAGRVDTTASVYYSEGSINELHGASLAHNDEILKDDANARSRPVAVKRLDGMVAAHGLKGPILLKVDTQGFEGDVIAGAEGILPLVEVAILEVLLFKFAVGRPTIVDMINLMAEKGFQPYDIFGGGNRPLDGAASHVDIAFVRADGMFRQDHRYAELVGGNATPGLLSRLRRLVGI